MSIIVFSSPNYIKQNCRMLCVSVSSDANTIQDTDAARVGDVFVVGQNFAIIYLRDPA